jgi:hypothetical protein
MSDPRKLEWQRRKRSQFKAEHGYSMTAHYATGGLREQVLRRDKYACVKCHMTDVEHRLKWGRPITIDHKDKNRRRNVLENLQTLCLMCHGGKDLIAKLRAPRLEKFKAFVLAARAAGRSCNSIAVELGFGCRVVTKWLRRWQKEDL